MVRDAAFFTTMGMLGSSALIPARVALRYGADAGRVAASLWPVLNVGAWVGGAAIYRSLQGVGASEPYVWALLLAMYAVMLVHFAAMVGPRMRSGAFRWGIIVPGTVLSTACALSIAVTIVTGLARWTLVLHDGTLLDRGLRVLDLVPVPLAALALVPSMHHRRELVRVRDDGSRPVRPVRLPYERSPLADPMPPKEPAWLRVAQLTDTHLGGLVSVAALRGLVERLLTRDPDLVLLTGDFLALEAMFTAGALAEALSPLRAAAGRTFATFGNHDHDAPGVVRGALEGAGVRLLLDEWTTVTTRVGEIEILGVDDRRGHRTQRRHLRDVLAQMPARTTRPQILLLHDPGRFVHLTELEAAGPAPRRLPDLVLSGHVHGGQVGLLSIGIPWTLLTPTRLPDHGVWGMGASRLYVHRGTGTFGFPLRLGVPIEESILELAVVPPDAAFSLSFTARTRGVLNATHEITREGASR